MLCNIPLDYATTGDIVHTHTHTQFGCVISSDKLILVNLRHFRGNYWTGKYWTGNYWTGKYRSNNSR